MQKLTTILSIVLFAIISACSSVPEESNKPNYHDEGVYPKAGEMVPYDISPKIDYNSLLASLQYPKAGGDVSATVYVRALIDIHGSVVKAEIEKSDAEVFNNAALTAARNMQCQPGINNGLPINMWVVFPIQFSPPTE